MSLSLNGRHGQSSPLGALAGWLMDNHYSSHAIGVIVGHADRAGTPTGCVYLDREDEETATEVYIEAMDPIGHTDSAWGSPSDCVTPRNPLDDCWTPSDGRQARQDGTDGPGPADELERLLDAWESRHEAEIELLELSRLEPTTEDYIPTPEDEAWLAEQGIAPICGGAPAGSFRRVVRLEGGATREEPAEESAVREALSRMYGADSVDRLIDSMVRDGRTCGAQGGTYFWDPFGAELLQLPPIRGGAPEPYRPTEADWADYYQYRDLLDAIESGRQSEARFPRYGYE